jgi:hypothetical protein
LTTEKNPFVFDAEKLTQSKLAVKDFGHAMFKLACYPIPISIELISIDLYNSGG